jgi:hypothetical protein
MGGGDKKGLLLKIIICKRALKTVFDPLPYGIFRGAQPMACGLFSLLKSMTLGELKLGVFG